MSELNSQVWDQWARLPETRAFEAELTRSIEDAKEAWSRAGYTSETEAVATRLNTVALAQIEMLRQIQATIAERRLTPQMAEHTEGSL